MDLKQILTDIARAIVDTPDAVNVTETVDGDNVELILTVAEDDTGMVIGRHGKHHQQHVPRLSPTVKQETRDQKDTIAPPPRHPKIEQQRKWQKEKYKLHRRKKHTIPP